MVTQSSKYPTQWQSSTIRNSNLQQHHLWTYRWSPISQRNTHPSTVPNSLMVNTQLWSHCTTKRQALESIHQRTSNHTTQWTQVHDTCKHLLHSEQVPPSSPQTLSEISTWFRLHQLLLHYNKWNPTTKQLRPHLTYSCSTYSIATVSKHL